MNALPIALPDEAATAALGVAIAGALGPGEAVCLSGPLGVGKSVLARALVRAVAGRDTEVPSPTFTLVQFYEGPGLQLAHFDLYRLTDPGEAYEIGLDEALDLGAAIIEWPERLEGRLPPDRLDICLAMGERETARTARLTGAGAWAERSLELVA